LIKQRRAEMGISQRKLATRVGVSDAYIAQLETRERTNSSLDVRRRLVKAFKV
jgi:transcriptional regulator with XRE-family HTH domain